MSDEVEHYRDSLAAAMQVRDEAVLEAGDDEDARKAAIAAFDFSDAEARRNRDAQLTSEQED